MKNFQLCLLAFVFSTAICFGQCNPDPLRPSLLPPCPTIMDQISGAMDAANDFNRDVVQANREIDDARARFWKAYPDGGDFKAAEEKFLYALSSKDMYYLMLALPGGMNGDLLRGVNLMGMLNGSVSPDDFHKFPSNVDHGIRPYAFPLFVGWVNALRRAAGIKTEDELSANPLLLPSAYQDRSNERKAYEDARDWSEFICSGVDLSKYLTPQVYLFNQMEHGVCWVVEQKAKNGPMPDGEVATRELYDLFVKTFGEEAVVDAAKTVLRAPKNSVGGLAKPVPVSVGACISSEPSHNPYLWFLTLLTGRSARNYAIALNLDPYALLGDRAIETCYDKDQWAKAVTAYHQRVAQYGEARVVEVASRLMAVVKDSPSGPRGDPQARGALYWFDEMLKNPKAELPDVARFKVSSYDPHWLGKIVEVRGTVSRVDLAKGQFPPYATIHFKESTGDRLTAFTPNSDMWQASYGNSFSGLIGRPVEVWGQVTDWKEGAGVRIITSDQVKVLDSAARLAIEDSRPAWLTAPLPVETLVDSPQYLAWKNHKPGQQAAHDNWVFIEGQPGVFHRYRLSHDTWRLQSINAERAVVSVDIISFNPMNGSQTESTTEPIYKAKIPPPPPERPLSANPRDGLTTTTGRETLVISGTSIPTRWTMVASAKDPQSYVKTWTSDEVPGGLVRKSSHGAGQVQETLWEPVDGVVATLPSWGSSEHKSPQQRYQEAMQRSYNAELKINAEQQKLGFQHLPPDVMAITRRLNSDGVAAQQALASRDNAEIEPALKTFEDSVTEVEAQLASGRFSRSATAPPAAAQTLAPATQAPQPQQTPAATRTPPARTTIGRRAALPDREAQAKLFQRYNAVMLRTEKDRGQLLRLERAQPGALPADVQTAQAQLRTQTTAVLTALRKRDPAEMDQATRSLEDSLTVIEKYLNK